MKGGERGQREREGAEASLNEEGERGEVEARERMEREGVREWACIGLLL